MRERINKALRILLGEIYQEKGITTGDIQPLQLVRWDNLVDDLTKLFTELITFNESDKIRE